MSKAGEPHVGIFWLFQGRLILDSTPVSQGEAYGNHIGHATAHIDHWSRLQERGVVPAEVEYDEVPRGRITCDAKSRRFWLMADKCILSRPALVQEVARELHLPNETEISGDWHYRCATCLRRDDDRDHEDE